MDKSAYPEHIRQAVDLISAVLRRIKHNRLDKTNHKSLYIRTLKGGRYGEKLNACKADCGA